VVCQPSDKIEREEVNMLTGGEAGVRLCSEWLVGIRAVDAQCLNIFVHRRKVHRAVRRPAGPSSFVLHAETYSEADGVSIRPQKGP
jgi:hypothetical protein